MRGVGESTRELVVRGCLVREKRRRDKNRGRTKSGGDDVDEEWGDDVDEEWGDDVDEEWGR